MRPSERISKFGRGVPNQRLMRTQTAVFWVLWTHNESVKLWIKHYPAMAKVLPSPHRKRDPVDRIASAATSMLASVDSSLADVLKDTDLASSAIPDTIEEDTKFGA